MMMEAARKANDQAQNKSCVQDSRA